MEGHLSSNHQTPKQRLSPHKTVGTSSHYPNKQNQVGTVMLYGIPIVSLVIESQERLCLAQISNTLLKQYSYNEIHNRRVALGITCVQCTPVQLEILRRAGAMPVSSRRCGMITRREAERLCKSFLGDNAPPRLPDDFAFSVHHECAWGCRGAFLPSRYNSSRAKCIKCSFCGLFFSPNKFIFHSHRTSPNATYVQPDAANFNSWRRHMKLSGSPPDDVVHAWEDVKAMFNGGTRKRLLASSSGAGTLATRPSVSTTTAISISATPSKQMKLESPTSTNPSFSTSTSTPLSVPNPSRVPPFSDLPLPLSVMDYVWQNGVSPEGSKSFPFSPYAVPWFNSAKRSVLGLSSLSAVSSQQDSLLQHLCPPNPEKLYHQSAFRPVFPAFGRPDILLSPGIQSNIIKRQMSSEELFTPKKRYIKDMEKIENLTGNEESVGNECRIVAGSVDKENELRKSTGNATVAPEVLASDSHQSLRLAFKKELVSEASNDSEDEQKSLSRAQLVPETKDLIDVTKLLSVKSNFLDEGVFKFREFSPNLLEAITSLKAEERGVHSGLGVKTYPGLSADKEVGDGRRRETEAGPEKRGEKEQKREEKEGEEEEDEPKSDEEDEDETVDVETTDDIPDVHHTLVRIQNAFLDPTLVTGIDGDHEAKEDGKSKIWTIARFSLENSDSFAPQPGFCCGTGKGRKMVDEGKEIAQDRKKSKPPSVECAGCCEVAFGNG